MTAAALLALAVAAPPAERMLEDADRLAARARASPEEKREAAAKEALDAYSAILEAWPKDRETIPRARRRRAALLQHLGRVRDAIAEHDAILAGRARRKDRARALYDGAMLLAKAGDLHGAERRLARVGEEYGDVSSTRGKALLARAALLRDSGRAKEAQRLFQQAVHDCRHEEKLAIEAYDALALMALDAGDPASARRWIARCMDRYRKRAERGDKFGDYVARLLGDMKAPARLASAPVQAPR